jgi:hypothetical protein
MSNGISNPPKFLGQLKKVLEWIDAARIDGRARNVLYRMKQLLLIQNFLVKRKADISKALQEGTIHHEQFL